MGTFSYEIRISRRKLSNHSSLSIERFDYSVLFFHINGGRKITRHDVALSHFVTVFVASHHV